MNEYELIKLVDVGKIYHTGKLDFEALKNVDLSVTCGEYIAILGPSGSGKSTLMQIIGCLSTPTCGTYYLNGEKVSHLTRNQLARVRSQQIGFVFQNFNLLSQLDIVDNVALPLVYQGIRSSKRRQKAIEMLEHLHLGDHLTHHPNELSGGEKQRVAIARALITNPNVILADEPTGNLDSKSGEIVIKLFEGFASEGKTVIMVTHDLSIAKRAKRIIHIRDGELTNGDQ